MPVSRAHAPRIEEVRITPVAFRDPPLLAATGMHEPWCARTIVEVVCEGGIVGLSETYGDMHTIADLRAIAPKLIGLRVTELQKLMKAVETSHNGLAGDASARGPASPRTSAALRVNRLFAAFETALLDATGRSLGVTLCELLGGPVRDRVSFSAYLFFKPAAHPGFEPSDMWGEALDPEGIVAQAGKMIERHGFRSLKLKGGVFEPELEIDCIAALAAAFPGLPLRIDPNGNWTRSSALKVLPRLEGLIQYLEDPVLGHEDMAAIRAEASFPLATNMCVTSLADLPAAVRLGSVDVVLADHHFWGGLRETVTLSRVCQTFGLGLSMHSNSHLGISLMAMTHVAAACPNLVYDSDTHYPWNSTDLLAGDPALIRDGFVRIPESPGLGIEIDQAALARMAEDYTRHAPTHRDDTTFMLKFKPDWTAQRPRF